MESYWVIASGTSFGQHRFNMAIPQIYKLKNSKYAKINFPKKILDWITVGSPSPVIKYVPARTGLKSDELNDLNS